MTAPTARSYKLGPVLPHVRWAAEQVGAMFDVDTILGWRATARDMAGHPAGRALDYMTSSSGQGWAIVEHLLANAEGYGLVYAIFEQTYLKPDGTREPMEDRGSPTQNHMDHVHAQFGVLPGTKAVDQAAGSGSGGLNPLAIFDGWQADLTGTAVKLTVAAGALALVVLGATRTVTPGRTTP